MTAQPDAAGGETWQELVDDFMDRYFEEANYPGEVSMHQAARKALSNIYAQGQESGITAALKVAPEKMTQTKSESNSDWFYGSGNNSAIEAYTANIKKLLP